MTYEDKASYGSSPPCTKSVIMTIMKSVMICDRITITKSVMMSYLNYMVLGGYH